MIFSLLFGVLGAAGLLAVLGILSSGQVRFDDANIIRRREKPATFFGLVLIIALISGALLATTVSAFWQMFTSGG